MFEMLKPWNRASCSYFAGCVRAFFGDELEKGQATENCDTTWYNLGLPPTQ